MVKQMNYKALALAFVMLLMSLVTGLSSVLAAKALTPSVITSAGDLPVDIELDMGSYDYNLEAFMQNVNQYGHEIYELEFELKGLGGTIIYNLKTRDIEVKDVFNFTEQSGTLWHISKVEGVEIVSRKETTADTVPVSTGTVTIYSLHANNNIISDTRYEHETISVTGNFTELLADITAPTLSGVSNKTIELGETVDLLGGVTAYDTRDGDLTSAISVDTAELNLNAFGSYTVTYSVSDSSGNTATQTIAVNVTLPPDITAPVISGVINKQVEVGGTVDFLTGVTAFDEVDGDLTNLISVDTSELNLNAVGSYTVTYSVSDGASNISTETITVTVTELADTTTPVISGASNLIVELGEIPNLLNGVTAFDDRDGDLTSAISVDTSDLNLNAVGSYEIEYSVSDSSGNTSTQAVTITVTLTPPDDRTKPVISGAVNKQFTVGAYFNLLNGLTAFDEVDGDLTNAIEVYANGFNTNSVGYYTVRYTVSDNAGNTASKSVLFSVGVATVEPTGPTTNEPYTFESLEDFNAFGFIPISRDKPFKNNGNKQFDWKFHLPPFDLKIDGFLTGLGSVFKIVGVVIYGVVTSLIDLFVEVLDVIPIVNDIVAIAVPIIQGIGTVVVDIIGPIIEVVKPIIETVDRIVLTPIANLLGYETSAELWFLFCGVLLVWAIIAKLFFNKSFFGTLFKPFIWLFKGLLSLLKLIILAIPKAIKWLIARFKK